MNDVQINEDNSHPTLVSMQAGDLFRFPSGRAVYMRLMRGFIKKSVYGTEYDYPYVHLGTGDLYTGCGSKAVMRLLPGTTVTITPTQELRS